jgi:O-antigen/teichoic acid export membrane protein
MDNHDIEVIEQKIDNSQDGKSFKKIFKNFSFLTLGKIGGDFFNLVLFIVLSRKFGQSGIGEYSFAFGLTGFFSILADFGLYDYSIKEISRNINDFEQSYSGIFSLRLVLVILFLILLIAVTPLLNFSAESKLVIIFIGSFQIIYVLIDGLASVFVAHEQMFAAGLIAASSRVMTSLSGVLIALLAGSLVFSMISFPIISLVQFIILVYIVNRKFGKIKLTFSFQNLKQTLKHTLPYGIADFFAMIFLRIDVVLIGFLVGEAASGIYNVGYRVIFFLLFIPNFAAVSIFPIISRMFQNSKNEFRKMYNKSLSMMVIIGVPISAGLWLIAPQLIDLVFGNKFAESALILRILSALFLFKCILSIMSFFMMSSNNQNEYAKAQSIATVFSFVANFILIYFYGIEGAAVATVLASFVFVMICGFKLKNVIGIPDIKFKILISIIGIAAFCVPVSFFPDLSIFAIIPISSIIYLGTILLFKDIRNNELKLFFNLIKA